MNYFAIPGTVANIDILINTVCRHYQTTRADIMVKQRDRNLVEPRQVIMELVRNYMARPARTHGKTEIVRYSLSEIGYMFRPMKDHATVLHSVRLIETLKGIDKPFAAKYAEIISDLERQGLKRMKGISRRGKVVNLTNV